MNLREFTQQALVQIAGAIRDADPELKKLGAIVNPRNFHSASGLHALIDDQGGKNQNRGVHSVEFDVAVTAVEGTETKGGIGVAIGVVGIGSQGKSQESNTTVSRLKFSIPVAFPNGGDG